MRAIERMFIVSTAGALDKDIETATDNLVLMIFFKGVGQVASSNSKGLRTKRQTAVTEYQVRRN